MGLGVFVFMAYLQNIDQVRSVEWAKSHLWDVKLETAPAPFNEWFPAFQVEFEIGDVVAKVIDTTVSQFKIPGSMHVRSIRLHFYDDVEGTLELWFDDWINRVMFNRGLKVSTISEVTKVLHLMRVGTDKPGAVDGVKRLKKNQVVLGTTGIEPPGQQGVIGQPTSGPGLGIGSSPQKSAPFIERNPGNTVRTPIEDRRIAGIPVKDVEGSGVGKNIDAFKVFPEGTLIWMGTSETGTRIFMQSFAVLGIEKTF